MKIIIPKYINSKSYNIKKKSSVSFVENIDLQALYVIKGIWSDLWNLIIETRDYKIVYDYAVANNFEKFLPGYLFDLKEKKLIVLNYFPISIQTKTSLLHPPISKYIKNFIYFEKIQAKIACDCGYLSTLYLILNYNCNLSCRHCCNPKDKNIDGINFQIACKLIDEACTLGVNEICLTGGECTLSEDFFKIAEYVRLKYLKLHIFSNCQKLYDNQDFFNKLVEIYPTTVQISLYSMNSEVHDFITQVKGSHLKTISVIKKLRERNIDVLISCFQMSYNSGHDKAVKIFAKSVGARFLTSCIFINNINNNNLSSKLSIKDIKNYYEKTINKNNLRDKFIKCNKPICSAGFDKICVTPSLDITPCIYFDYILANYKKHSLLDVKENYLPSFRKKFIISNLKECFNYDYCEYCSFCPTNSVSEGSDFLMKSDILCEDAMLYKEVVNLKNIE